MKIRESRSGFTLPELMIITLLTAIVIGGMTTTLARQQRFYRGTADIIETRSQIRQAAGILPTDLRGISTIGGDLTSMSDTSMTFRATIGSSVACIPPVAATVFIPPISLTSGNTLTHWSLTPAVGDIAFIYDDFGTDVASDDVWREYTLSEAATPLVGGCPSASSAFTEPEDDAKPSYTFKTSVAPSPTILPGAPIRFVRTTIYSLYKASDGKWYLGYCSPSCAVGGRQTIAGPFLPYASATSSGVSFSYLNSAGAVTNVPAQVAQVSILVRAETNTPQMSGFTKQVIGDSLRFTVAIRNRQ